MARSSSEVKLRALARAAKASSVGAKTVMSDVVESSKFTSPAACMKYTKLVESEIRLSSAENACSGGEWRYSTLIAAARVCRLCDLAARA